ncbi:DinB family protein [Rufibacter sp. LB8]|uniref:DinB family protein n=1 Tax=Rufibacter sp. LB8 TaxID=2777781 RepID=UPI00178C3730|nr:DinB family protein [Rufibacter sp. LB8]
MHPSFQKKYTQLEKHRQTYTAQVRALSPDQQQKPPGEGQWSAAQLYYHLWKVENTVLQAIEANLASGRTHKPVSFNTRYRSFLLNLALALPFKFKVPKMIGDMPPNVSVAEVEEKWQATSQQWQQFLEKFPEHLQQKEIFKHPRAGLLTMNQTLQFLLEHAAHHKLQMQKLVTA